MAAHQSALGETNYLSFNGESTDFESRPPLSLERPGGLEQNRRRISFARSRAARRAPPRSAAARGGGGVPRSRGPRSRSSRIGLSSTCPLPGGARGPAPSRRRPSFPRARPSSSPRGPTADTCGAALVAARRGARRAAASSRGERGAAAPSGGGAARRPPLARRRGVLPADAAVRASFSGSRPSPRATASGTSS